MKIVTVDGAIDTPHALGTDVLVAVNDYPEMGNTHSITKGFKGYTGKAALMQDLAAVLRNHEALLNSEKLEYKNINGLEKAKEKYGEHGWNE